MNPRRYVPIRDILAGVAAAFALASTASAAPDPTTHDTALTLLEKAVSFRTVAGGGQTPALAEYLKGQLVASGFAAQDVTVEPVAGSAILIARYRGTDRKKKPIVILDHMDVVEAKPADWTRDPFTPVVENGYVFGRGVYDDKFDVAVIVTALGDLKRQGWRPGRDVVLALSGDEETKMATTRRLAAELKDAELVLNGDGAAGLLGEDGKPVVYRLQGAEKTYADFSITITDPGGHSSRPTKTNAIYELARDLGRLAAYSFPVQQSEITKGYFAATGAQTPGPLGQAMRRFAADPKDQAAIATLADSPEFVGQLKTTCVATMVSAGHAPNALPQRASATVNCRIFPGTPSEDVRKTLIRVLDDPKADVVRLDDGSIDAPASPLRPDVVAAVTKAVHGRYPGLPIVPFMAAGASDSMFFRAEGIPAFGASGLFMKASDDFAHGLNERAPVAGIDGDIAHWESLLKDLAK